MISSVLRGLGLGTAGFVFTISAYYAVGIPLGIKFAFLDDQGIKGLLKGQIIAGIILSLIILIIMECSDWHQLNS